MLTNTEQKLASTDIECLPLLWAVFLVQLYLHPSRFIICTKKEVLEWLLKSADVFRKLERCRLLLRELGFEVVHQANIKQRAPDTFSILKSAGRGKTNSIKELSVLMIYESKEQHDVGTKFYNEAQSFKEKSATR